MNYDYKTFDTNNGCTIFKYYFWILTSKYCDRQSHFLARFLSNVPTISDSSRHLWYLLIKFKRAFKHKFLLNCLKLLKLYSNFVMEVVFFLVFEIFQWSPNFLWMLQILLSSGFFIWLIFCHFNKIIQKNVWNDFRFWLGFIVSFLI